MVGVVQVIRSCFLIACTHMNLLFYSFEELLCDFSDRFSKQLSKKDSGAITAEYAVVLSAATGFAALLIIVLKSESVRNMLNDLIKRALHIS